MVETGVSFREDGLVHRKRVWGRTVCGRSLLGEYDLVYNIIDFKRCKRCWPLIQEVSNG